MVFKIKTSKQTMEIFDEIESRENLQPFVLAKLSISMSLKENRNLSSEDFETDTNGLELNRQTITGEYDDLFKCLFMMKEQCHINDDDYFQRYMKAHIDRGAKLLFAEFKYNRDFILSLLQGKRSI